MKRTVEIVPSLPAASFAEFERLFNALKGISAGFQVDLVDGQFVSAPPSWPYNQAPKHIEAELLRLSPHANDFALALDCMIESPQRLFPVFAKIGVSRVIIHVGSTSDLGEVVKDARSHGFVPGFGVTNDVPFSSFEPLLAEVDFVQVMGIAHIGQQGQPFDTRTITTVERLVRWSPDLLVAVDGSVNEQTIPLLVEAGATRLTPGSAVAKAPDPVAAYRSLLQLANS